MPRLFFALCPDEPSRAALASAASETLRLCEGRRVPSESWHVTLAFLGSVPRERVAALVKVAGSVTAAGPVTLARPVRLGKSVPLPESAWVPRLSFDRIEYWKKAELLCAVAQRQPIFEDFATALREQLTSASFAPDLKPFRAHVTLARKVPAGHAAQRIARVEWTLERFALVESRTVATGSIYSVVESWSLVRASA